MGGRRSVIIGCAAAVAVVTASAPAALAAPGVDPQALNVPAITQLRRVGVAIVGAQVSEAVAARDLAAKSLIKAGHAVAALPTLADAPSPAWMVAVCSDRDLDAVALVRISTDPTGFRVNVDIRDPDGEPIVVRSVTSRAHDPFTGQGAPEPVHAAFSFEMSAADVAAQQQMREAEGLDGAVAAPAAAAPAAPHLFVSEKVVMYGPAELKGAEFYRVVGRPELAAMYERKSSSIRAVRGVGYTALGIGGTTLVLALVAAAAAPAACALPNTIDTLDGKQPTCGQGVGALFLIPLAFGATGGVLLATAATMTRDPLTLSERRALAREYNARVDGAAEQSPAPAPARPPRQIQIGVAGAPLPSGNGGVMLLTGRF